MAGRLAGLIVVMLAFAGGSTAVVGAPAAMPPGAVACGGCHPRAAGAAVPPLQGMPAAAIETAMRAFRSGERPATVMDRIPTGFSEDEGAAIAAFFAAEPAP
jgi:cytochrome subunit of sulfide dehydrogenase